VESRRVAASEFAKTVAINCSTDDANSTNQATRVPWWKFWSQ